MDKASIHVRPAVASDIDRIFAMEQETAEAPHWSLPAYQSMLHEEALVRHCLLVAERTGAEPGREILGFLAGSFLPGDAAAELESIVVAAEARRKGVAKALCEALARWALDLGAAALRLEVRESNGSARSAYLRLGFIEEGRRRDYYRDPDEDAILMHRALP